MQNTRRNNKNNKRIDQVVTPAPPSSKKRKINFTNTSSVSEFISSSFSILSNDPNINSRIQNLGSNRSNYVKSAEASVRRFFHVMSQHETLSPLTEAVKDPAAPLQTEHQLIILTRGKKNQGKYKISNTALIFIAMHTKKLDTKKLTWQKGN